VREESVSFVWPLANQFSLQQLQQVDCSNWQFYFGAIFARSFVIKK